MSQVFEALRRAEQIRKNREEESSATANAAAYKPKVNVGPPAYLGRSLRVRGQITGQEALQVDGQVEGAISLENCPLTVGRTGQIKATIVAGEVVVDGQVDGELRATERIVIKKDACVSGTVTARRIAIEDGAQVNATIQQSANGR